jgi:hypothetical protein
MRLLWHIKTRGLPLSGTDELTFQTQEEFCL